ncbi:MAG TPA: cyclic nucleotide-binding domain-containing protein [Stellaceae bacterium]|nr:cyclic nucleotide-binding domain-containing protein [Stellaceae bacterium]
MQEGQNAVEAGAASDSQRSEAGEALARLQDIAVFAELPDEVLARIADKIAPYRAAEQTVLFRQGELPEFLYILLSGQVVLDARAADGVETIIEILTPVEVFQLAASLTNAPYLTSARILKEAQLLTIPAALLRQMIEAQPPLALTMLASMSRHYRMLLRQVKDLKLRSAAQRLGCFILGLGRQQGFPQRIKLPFDKQFLAARLGTTPENLSRAFATLRSHGVATSGSHVVVNDPMRLAAFSVPDEAG